MLDTIIVGTIVLIAALFVARRLYIQFSAKTPACGCSGCGNSGSCSQQHECIDITSRDANR